MTLIFKPALSPIPSPGEPDAKPAQVSPIPRRAAVAAETEWWRAPFILAESRGRRRRELAANRTTLEAALASPEPEPEPEPVA